MVPSNDCGLLHWKSTQLALLFSIWKERNCMFFAIVSLSLEQLFMLLFKGLEVGHCEEGVKD